MLWAALPPPSLSLGSVAAGAAPQPPPDAASNIQLIRHNLLHYKPLDWQGAEQTSWTFSQGQNLESKREERAKSCCICPAGHQGAAGSFLQARLCSLHKAKASWCPKALFKNMIEMGEWQDSPAETSGCRASLPTDSSLEGWGRMVLCLLRFPITLGGPAVDCETRGPFYGQDVRRFSK